MPKQQTRSTPLLIASISALCLTVLAVVTITPLVLEVLSILLPHGGHSPTSEWTTFAFGVSFVWTFGLYIVPYIVVIVILGGAAILGIIGSRGNKPKVLQAAAVLSGFGFTICCFDTYLDLAGLIFYRSGSIGYNCACIVVFVRALLFSAVMALSLQRRQSLTGIHQNVKLPEYDRLV